MFETTTVSLDWVLHTHPHKDPKAVAGEAVNTPHHYAWDRSLDTYLIRVSFCQASKTLGKQRSKP